MAVKLGSTVQDLINAVNEANEVPKILVQNENEEYILDCYDTSGNGDTIFGVYHRGNDAGTLKLGDGATQCEISLGEDVGTAGQVLTSQGSGKTPIWKTPSGGSTPSNMVTTNTAQSITGTKTFLYIRVTGNIIHKSCETVFENADGGQQSLSTDSSLGSSVQTKFVLPKINDDQTTFELSTALHCHCVTISATNVRATFQVICNKSTAFKSLEDIWTCVMNNQPSISTTRIAASGRYVGTGVSYIRIVEYVTFKSTKANGLSIHCVALTSATETDITATTFVSDLVFPCNFTTPI